jgi:succinoglycan biosynthesis protein ExoM
MAGDRISVCVCTFGRPEMLGGLLEALALQQTVPGFAFDVVIVDNDSRRSAEPVVAAFARRGTVAAMYDCEPERNISLARNRAIRNASGNLIAFIDDDETPQTDWLVRLYATYVSCAPDGVLGPVLPEFPPAAPGWLKKANVFSRRRHATGARIGEGDGRTGNVLLQRRLFVEDGCWFDPAFGRSGGEDSDFFHRQFERGGTFVWCDEAAVAETVPPERWTVSFHVKRLLRAGTTDGELMRAGKLKSDGLVVRNAVILCACVALITPALLLPKYLWVRVAQKLAYSGGVVAAYWGLPLLKHRD